MKRLFTCKSQLNLHGEAGGKRDLDLQSHCCSKPNATAPHWKLTYSANMLHLTARCNFRVRLLLCCYGLESDTAKFRPVLYRCNAEHWSATHCVPNPVHEPSDMILGVCVSESQGFLFDQGIISYKGGNRETRQVYPTINYQWWRKQTKSWHPPPPQVDLMQSQSLKVMWVLWTLKASCSIRKP